MEPLKNQNDPNDPTVRRAIALLSAVGPLRESRLRMRRVRLALDRAPRARGMALLRPAIVAGVLLGGIATAGATWGVVRMIDATDETSAAPLSVRGQPAASPARTRSSVLQRSTAPEAAEAPDEEPPSTEASIEKRERGTLAAPVKRRATPARPTPAPVVDTPVSEAKHSDSVLVQDAVKALRNGGDASQAAELLKRYRSRNPQGVLAEEALALSIEAAVQNNDPSARQLARQYLAKYPRGRFVAAARRAAR